jgi:hypothetical protein
MAFLAQSSSFPENNFELFNFLIVVVLLISAVQWVIWK